MKKINLYQKSLIEKPGNDIKAQSNPYTLFLILILLINSFGGINRITKNIKNILSNKKEGKE